VDRQEEGQDQVRSGVPQNKGGSSRGGGIRAAGEVEKGQAAAMSGSLEKFPEMEGHLC
jgi:hypothetical protein